MAEGAVAAQPGPAGLIGTAASAVSAWAGGRAAPRISHGDDEDEATANAGLLQRIELSAPTTNPLRDPDAH